MTATIPAESVAGNADFRPLSTIHGIRVDLRYATADNFAGRDLYSPLDCAFLHRDAAAALERSVAWLTRERPGATLLVLDAVRPQRVQEQLWAVLAGTEMERYLAHPSRGSIHSFGMAVDVTICDAGGRERDMGTPFDCLDERSHPAHEERLLASGAITREHVANRELLRAAMREGGWQGISTEWWHFDCGDRVAVRANYARIL
jgi:D-alanyl-D-alanine dipeptidase